MRITHILAAFVAFVALAACSTTDIDDVTSTPGHASQYLQVVGRVSQYTDLDVATRSKKEGDEPMVTSMGLALFPIVDGIIGNCLYYDYKQGGNIVFIVDRHDAVFNNYVDKQFAMYIFANMQNAEGFPTTSKEGVGKSLEVFTECATAANSNVEDVPATGFPMMGSLGNTIGTDGDGITLVLKPEQSPTNVDGLPLLNGSPSDNLEIPLRSMYAKFTFTISVKPDQEIVGNKAPRFDLLSYGVHNIAATVDSSSATNNDNAVIATSGDISVGNYAQGATSAKFDFYLPERYLTPSKRIDEVLPDELKNKKGTYDTSVDADQNGYRDEDEKYHQRFKNKLPGDNQAATYVTITGKYTDHQGHIYDVDYNIYLGGNNYDDFNIIRNTHYNNSITIRGLSASNDQSVGSETISIDWRVDVERSTPLVINLRRESLLDAHFEVRPLRLRLVGDDIPTGTSATVTILNEDGTANNCPSWIRLEKSGTNPNTYITEGVSAGKRKYFTTNLVTNTLQSGTKITLDNLTKANQTLWIYVDENTTTDLRTAIVRISYNGVDKDYKIVQHGLHKVDVGSRTYYIEEYEEYLFNYDAEDSYGQTQFEGMPWGLNGVQLSNEHKSFKCDETNYAWTSYVRNNTLPTYDFYIGKHDSFAEEVGGTVHNFAGQHFTSDIYAKSGGKVKNLTLAEQASGAVEYCYNRNKRNTNGSVASVDWYLPSADELEDFIVAAYSDFKEFQDKYYWTSQPAFERNVYYYEYRDSNSNVLDTYPFIVYDDNTEYARATKVVSRGNDVYDYANSGLESTPTPYVNYTDWNEVNYGYYYKMYIWRGSGSYTMETKTTYGNSKFNGGEEFYEIIDKISTGKRYHIHLGHLYDMTQEGYHERTKSNRVRCVRKVAN